MYTNRWSRDRLRQGDVIGKVFVPAVGATVRPVAKAQSLTSVSSTQPLQEVIVAGDWRYIAVISHDCEFNENKRNRFLVARIERVPGNLDVNERHALRASNDVEARAVASEDVAGVDSFLLDPIPGAFDEESVVAFTTITPLPTKLLGDYLKSKVAELEHEHRLLLRAKLAWFFGRFAEDVGDDAKFDTTPATDP